MSDADGHADCTIIPVVLGLPACMIEDAQACLSRVRVTLAS